MLLRPCILQYIINFPGSRTGYADRTQTLGSTDLNLYVAGLGHCISTPILVGHPSPNTRLDSNIYPNPSPPISQYNNYSIYPTSHIPQWAALAESRLDFPQPARSPLWPFLGQVPIRNVYANLYANIAYQILRPHGRTAVRPHGWAVRL